MPDFVFVFFFSGTYCLPGAPGESGEPGELGPPGAQGFLGYKGQHLDTQ